MLPAQTRAKPPQPPLRQQQQQQQMLQQQQVGARPLEGAGKAGAIRQQGGATGSRQGGEGKAAGVQAAAAASEGSVKKIGRFLVSVEGASD